MWDVFLCRLELFWGRCGGAGGVKKGPPVFEAFADPFFHALFAGEIIASPLGEVCLGNIGSLVVVAVEVALVAEAIRAGVVLVPQVARHS